jgi:hypothetical protein
MSESDGDLMLLHLDQLEALLNQEELPFSVIQSITALLTGKNVRSSDRTDRYSAYNAEYFYDASLIIEYTKSLSVQNFLEIQEIFVRTY